MLFQTPLLRARLLRRYKRFLADAVLADGTEVTAHCANPGAMTGLAVPGSTIWLEPNDDARRKLNYSWKLVELAGGGMACIDTALPNRLVGEALAQGRIPLLAGYDTHRPEVRFGQNSRVDFLLSGANRRNAYVEVKAVSLSRQPGLAEFPDTVTARGRKHLNALADIARGGERAVMLYLLNRTDCTSFTLAGDIDPAYAADFHLAREAGVEALCLATTITTQGMETAASVPVLE